MDSVKLKIKGAHSVVVMILDNGPSDRNSILREVRICFLKKLEIGSAKQAEELTKS